MHDSADNNVAELGYFGALVPLIRVYVRLPTRLGTLVIDGAEGSPPCTAPGSRWDF